MSERTMGMYRLERVALPGILEPGQYVVADAEGVVLAVEIDADTDSRDLADVLPRRPPLRACGYSGRKGVRADCIDVLYGPAGQG